jgi:murein L,D-transpeptidase YcbB/YkuD
MTIGIALALPQVMHPRVLAAVLLSAILVGCGRQAVSTPHLQALLAADAAPKETSDAVWADTRSFYSARDGTLAWVGADRPGDETAAALDALAATATHGLAPKEYREPQLRALYTALKQAHGDAEQRSQQLAELDVHLTIALLEAGRHVATGRVRPKSIDARWNARREAPDYVSVLTRAAERDVATFLEQLQPVHPEYEALRKALTSLAGQVAQGWPIVPGGSLKLGERDERVVTLRQRLAGSGYLDAKASLDSPEFDGDVETAVKRFQEHHGVPATGTLDRATLERLNVSPERRIAQVRMNLERWRWLPDDLGARHFIVNVPQFHLVAREADQPVLDMRVVVGKRGNETPLFSDEMEMVVFSPYWNIPETIALEETAPAAARDSDYLARNNMEILDASGEVASPEMIPWDDENALAGYRFRQRPGAGNALGNVKFLFPNKHAVYLHDTPAETLFRRIGRAFSHGCVRVEEPERLAEYVLRDQPEWTSAAIRTAMHAGTERHARLSQPIPIFIVYMTAWVDENGGLHFQDDVYGYDARQGRL